MTGTSTLDMRVSHSWEVPVWACLGVPMIRIAVFWGLYGSSYLGRLPYGVTQGKLALRDIEV